MRYTNRRLLNSTFDTSLAQRLVEYQYGITARPMVSALAGLDVYAY